MLVFSWLVHKRAAQLLSHVRRLLEDHSMNGVDPVLAAFQAAAYRTASYPYVFFPKVGFKVGFRV
jgi:hypothetical protein